VVGEQHCLLQSGVTFRRPKCENLFELPNLKGKCYSSFYTVT